MGNLISILKNQVNEVMSLNEEQRWHFVEDDKEIVIFVGNKASAKEFYKRRGGSKVGLHLLSMSRIQDGKMVPKPVVGKKA